MAFTPSLGNSLGFDDGSLVRVATTSISVHSQPDDESRIVSTWYRDELVHVYDEVVADVPAYNPVWYRVWGGYMHRAHLQKVKILYNDILPSLAEGERRLVEVTVPFAEPWRTSKAYGWQQLGFRLYFGSVHWVEAIEEGPTGDLWYRIYDDLTGFPYHVNAMHVKPIPLETLAPISPEIEVQHKRIEVDLTTQTLTAYEYDNAVLKTEISSDRGEIGILHLASGIPGSQTRGLLGEHLPIAHAPRFIDEVHDVVPARALVHGPICDLSETAGTFHAGSPKEPGSRSSSSKNCVRGGTRSAG
jgi:hypothetical protein